MRAVLLLTASMVFVCASAGAQTDKIGLYSDAGYANCQLVDDGPGPASVYVVHHNTSGSLGSQFMIRENSGVLLTYLGHSSSFQLIIGDPQSGMAVAYESCVNSDILVTVINYFKSGSSSACSSLQIVARPTAMSGSVESIDCFENRIEISGTRLVVNPDGSCACGPTTEMTNWGKIKDRFRD
jgi:hypothetical protein